MDLDPSYTLSFLLKSAQRIHVKAWSCTFLRGAETTSLFDSGTEMMSVQLHTHAFALCLHSCLGPQAAVCRQIRCDGLKIMRGAMVARLCKLLAVERPFAHDHTDTHLQWDPIVPCNIHVNTCPLQNIRALSCSCSITYWVLPTVYMNVTSTHTQVSG